MRPEFCILKSPRMVLMISWVWVHLGLGMTTKDTPLPYEAPANLKIKMTDVWFPQWPGRTCVGPTSLDVLAASSASQPFIRSLPGRPCPATLKIFMPQAPFTQLDPEPSLTAQGKSHPSNLHDGGCGRGSVESTSSELLRSPAHHRPTELQGPPHLPPCPTACGPAQGQGFCSVS